MFREVTGSALVTVLAMALLVGACAQQSPESSEPLVELRNKLAASEAEVASLKAQLEEAKAAARAVKVSASPARAARERPAARHAQKARAMCYKDYCPCDPPQGGPDTVLCDQLEAGLDVSVDMLIAGRGMREARRQLAEGDY